VVLEPVAGNNGECDQERVELRADRAAERGKALKDSDAPGAALAGR